MKETVVRSVMIGIGVMTLCAGLGIKDADMVSAKKKEKIVFQNVDDQKLSLIKGDTYYIEMDEEQFPEDAKVKYKSSKKKVVSVNKQGMLKAKKAGKAKITVEVEDVGKKSIKVSVRNFIKAKKLKVTTGNNKIFIGETTDLSCTTTPKKIDSEIEWSSADGRIATVDEYGKVTGVGAGKVKITAQDNVSKKKKSKTIYVRANVVTGLKAKKTNVVVGLSTPVQLETTVSPNYVTDNKLVYRSSDETVAQVSDTGLVTAKKVGKAQITVSWYKNGNVNAKVNIQVSRDKGQITKQMLDKLDLSTTKNLMIVAHPDDETLFGGAHLISDSYLVVVMTNGADKVRATDFNEAMDIADCKRLILTHPDNPQDKTTYYWEQDQLAVQADIRTLLNYKKWDTVVTHNPEGEYGHQHHKKVNRYTTDIYKENPDVTHRFLYFGKYYTKDKLTDAVKKTLYQTNDELFETKVKMLDCYGSKHWTCFTWLWHIQPYENWVYYEDWK